MDLWKPLGLLPSSSMPATVTEPSDEWKQILADPSTPVLTRTMEISMTPSTVVLTATLTVSDTHPFVSDAARGLISADLPVFSELAFGEMLINRETGVDFEYPTILDIDPETNTAMVGFTVKKTVDYAPSFGIYPDHYDGEIEPRNDQVIIHISGLLFSYLNPLPHVATIDRGSWPVPRTKLRYLLVHQAGSELCPEW